MHFVDAKGILTNGGGYPGFNVYRGCSHGCIYCDSRSECYGFTHPLRTSRSSATRRSCWSVRSAHAANAA